MTFSGTRNPTYIIEERQDIFRNTIVDSGLFCGILKDKKLAKPGASWLIMNSRVQELALLLLALARAIRSS